jgi:peptide/nickel transport system permease protein
MTPAWALSFSLLRKLLLLLFTITTLLFFLVRVAGDPATMLAGPEADPAQIAAVRSAYGLDRPLPLQYLAYLGQLVQLDFGRSLATGREVSQLIAEAMPATLLLASLAMGVTLVVSIPLGVWLGGAPLRGARRWVTAVIFVLQGIPGFVIGLLLIQWLAIGSNLLPSLGFGGPRTWILPSLTLASFLMPQLVRVIAANVTEALGAPYVRTARALGASEVRVLWAHVLPNALLGATALVGTQFAFLLSGSVISESIYAWPGIGLLLIDSTRTLDFPVMQAIALVVALCVFGANATSELLVGRLNPRLRHEAQRA